MTRLIEIMEMVKCPKYPSWILARPRMVNVRDACESCPYFQEITDYDDGMTRSVACSFGESPDYEDREGEP